MTKSAPTSAQASASERDTLLRFADEGDLRALEAAEQLLDRQQVRQRLKRMVGRREHVQHRRDVHARHFLEQFVVEYAARDDRVIAGERAGYVRHTLARADTQLVGWM